MGKSKTFDERGSPEARAVRGRRLWLLAAGCLLLTFTYWFAGQSTSGLAQESRGQTVLPQLLREGDYRIGPGDLIDVRVFEPPELSRKVRVSATGQIVLPFIGEVKAAGLTEQELAEAIRTKLLKFLRNPQVSVSVEEYESQPVWVIGAVNNPGVYRLKGPTRLLNLLALAGWLNDKAGTTAILIRASQVSFAPAPRESSRETASRAEAAAQPTPPAQRPDEAQDVSDAIVEMINLRDLSLGRKDVNVLVYPNDVVSIPEADKVYVVGNVPQPGPIPIREPLTLSRAIMMAGGVKDATKKEKVMIVRQEPGKFQRTEIPVDLAKIEKNRAEDPMLLPNDVVFVPSSTTKSLGRAIASSLATSAATVYYWFWLIK